jgi:hypothetical protein
MATKLEQVLALSQGTRAVQAFQLDDMPMLEGPRPEQIARFNEGLREWKRRTEVRLSEQMKVPTVQG